jgi:hypothetical protein
MGFRLLAQDIIVLHMNKVKVMQLMSCQHKRVLSFLLRRQSEKTNFQPKWYDKPK